MYFLVNWTNRGVWYAYNNTELSQPAFAVVTFTPQTQHLHSAVFEAQVEESSR